MTLLTTAIVVGFLHTLVGPDHYLPFIVIGRARKWGLGPTTLLTFVCGVGHVLSSVVLGLVGALAGFAMHNVEGWEGARGQWAGWALIIFGAAYTAWGLYKGLRGQAHGHTHLHDDGRIHRHDHGHGHDEGHPSVHAHAHAHADRDEPPDDEPVSWKGLTPWLLFLIFVLGPCEPLVPMFFASALAGDWGDVLLVTVGYLGATLVGMHLLVTVFWFGLKRVSLGPLERWGNSIAGIAILLAGLAMVFLGL